MAEHEIRSGTVTASKISGRDDWGNAQADVAEATDTEQLEVTTRSQRSPAESARIARRYRDAASFLRDAAADLDRGAARILTTLSDVATETLAEDKRRTSEQAELATDLRD